MTRKIILTVAAAAFAITGISMTATDAEAAVADLAISSGNMTALTRFVAMKDFPPAQGGRHTAATGASQSANADTHRVAVKNAKSLAGA